MAYTPPKQHFLPEAFLQKLIADIDDDTVSAIILHGSYARGNAHPPYSDVDIVRITYETPERPQQKRFVWYDGYLLNLSSRPLSIYEDWLGIPEEAIFRFSTVRDARILVDKHGTFRSFQQRILATWRWEPLQCAADAYASKLMVELSEVILRTLWAIRTKNASMLTERIYLHILPTVMEAVGVQGGILARGDQYLQQVQEAMGLDSTWTRAYNNAAGTPSSAFSLEERGVTAIHLYQETITHLKTHFLPEHWKTIEPVLQLIDHTLQENIA